jgi:transcription elongation factor GreB
MSKAFTKETDRDEDLEQDDQDPSLPSGFKNYMTEQGSVQLQEELRRLLYAERPEVVKVVSWAASNGDRSENGDYLYGKRRLREIDRRVRFLTKRLDSAVIVKNETLISDQVLFGAYVKFINEDSQEKLIRIVGIDETDPSRGFVSWISPLAKALLQSKKGDVVLFRSPKGEEELEIIDVYYQSL